MASKQVSFEDALLNAYGDEDDQVEMFDMSRKQPHHQGVFENDDAPE